MKKCKIEKINNYYYSLKDNHNNKYEINIEFYDINDKICVGDTIYINEKLLKENILNFGLIDSIYGRKIDNFNDIDIIVLETKRKKLYLKRIYG